ncbi:MAG: cytochrome c maturation protein CcmE [Candidatus Methanoperedens sp.]|nr:cytochrome c maturation protein CcmE [Candidatus Methanoperedens sp.]
MKKKQRFILGVSIVIVLLAYLVLIGVPSSNYEVSQAIADKTNLTDKVILINGTMVQGTDKWDGFNRTLTFKLTDGISTIDVVFTGDKPNLPPQEDNESNVQAVVTGKFDDNDVFRAYQMLTKCPSKYEGSGKLTDTAKQ